MARIKIKNKWYEQVEPSTFSESEFEDRVAVHAPSVYSFYHVLPFKKKVQAPDLETVSGVSSVVPDLVFIAKDYSSWWVVEVEMTHHSLNSHVVPQVEQLSNADYGDDEIRYLLNKYPTILEKEKLTALIRSIPVRVLIIANKKDSKWDTALKNKATIAIFELYRANDDHEVFRVNGKYPALLLEKVSNCSFHPIIPRLLGVDEPDKLDNSHGNFVVLLYNECLTEWRKIVEGNQTWLTATSRNPLDSRFTYSIYRQNDGNLTLVQE